MKLSTRLVAEHAALRLEIRDMEAILRGAMPGTTLLGDTLARAVVVEVAKLRELLARNAVTELYRLRKVLDNIETLYHDKDTPPEFRIILAALCGPLVAMDPMCPGPSSTTGTPSSTRSGKKRSSSPARATPPARRKTKRSSGSKR